MRWQCIEDLEHRRHDEAYLNGLGADGVPDPTIAGDFCRRFAETDVQTLMNLINDVRMRAWQQQPDDFFTEAVLDAQGHVFNFGMDAMPNVKALAESVAEETMDPAPTAGALRSQDRTPHTPGERQGAGGSPARLHEPAAEGEQVTELAYGPTACHKVYRLIIVRKTIEPDERQPKLFDEIRY